jgi:DNA-binding NtrC family response regulator
MHSVLVLDDDLPLVDTLVDFLGGRGLQVDGFTRPAAALERLKSAPADLLITDVDMPELDGLTVLERARRIRPDCEVLILTGIGSIEMAVQALKRGAVDFLTKPISLGERLLPSIEQILAPPPGRLERDEPGIHEGFGAVEQSAAMRSLFAKLPRIAKSDSSVLLHGESGTGKEVFARAIHALSPRSRAPIVAVNCASIPEALFESELFGHRKGAFSGAERDREGLIAQAHEGTLFLDEIGELPQPLQAKLLRTLQDGEYRRVGDNEPRRASFRLIAATNRDLRKLDRDGCLRSDLYYRIAVIQIALPPLRDRPDDVAPLARAFVERLAPGRTFRATAAAVSALETYPWPGNVRELRNAIEHALVLADGELFDLEHLPVSVQEHAVATCGEIIHRDALEQIEVGAIRRALERARGNQSEAARLLGITRRTLGYRIRKYGLLGESSEGAVQLPLVKVALPTRAAARWKEGA